MPKKKVKDLLEGDKEMLVYLEEQIEKANLKKEAIDSRAWEVIKNTIEEGIKRRNDSLNPPNLEYQVGFINCFKLMLGWANRVEKELQLFNVERQEILKGE